MINVYSYGDPVSVIRDYADNLPAGQKRGIFNRLAQAAQIYPSYLSQILKGDRQLNLDQAAHIAGFMQFSDMETKYFLRLTEMARAQSELLKSLISSELTEMRKSQNQISKHVENHQDVILNEQDKARFYSSWVYAAVRTLCAVPGFQDSDAIAFKLGVPEKEIRGVIDFLLRTGLCVLSKEGLTVGPTHIHLDNFSPYINAHHANWRRRAMENHLMMDPVKEMAYSVCLTLTEEDALKIRNMIINFVRETREISDPSKPEAMYSLNIDWLEV
ncbi:hypothetical protein D3C87_257040 [compost metagenome]